MLFRSSQEMLGRAFRKCGFPLPMMVFSAVEGLDFLHKAEGRFIKLILVDLNLPAMSGFEFLAELRKSSYQLIPVVIFSTSVDPSDIQRSYLLRANAYISKPSGYSELIKTMQSVNDFFFNCIQLPDVLSNSIE